MTLTMAPTGKALIVNQIIGNDATRSRLKNLGFVSGADCLVISSCQGNLIAVIKDTRIALDQRLGNRIIVNQRAEEQK